MNVNLIKSNYQHALPGKTQSFVPSALYLYFEIFVLSFGAVSLASASTLAIANNEALFYFLRRTLSLN
jgi:hypothetical protein